MATEPTPEPHQLSEATLEQVQRHRLGRSLSRYAPSAWEQTQPTVPFAHNWHHDAMAEHLEAVSLGQIRFLLISVAPRHSKSWYVSVFWPTWHWTRWPATQFVYASYSVGFAVRDAIYSRRLMDTDWYQQRWGCGCPLGRHAVGCQGFRWTTDQNVITHYENDRGGRRFTAGVKAGTTGQGGDILCLEGSTLIETEDGPLPIARIVEERLQTRVLGSSGRWQKITGWHRSSGRPLVELETSDGGILRCTEEHPLWVEGRGYVPAMDVICSADEVLLRRLRRDVRPQPSPRRETEPERLLESVLVEGADGSGQSLVGGRSGHLGLRALQGRVLGAPGRGGEATILLASLPRGSTTRGAAAHLQRVLTNLHPQEQRALLLDTVLEHDPPNRHSRPEQRPLPARGMAHAVLSRVSEILETAGEATGCLLPDVPGEAAVASRSPSRRLEDRSRGHQPGDPLRALPPTHPHEEGDPRAHDETVRLVSARRCPSPAAVYNLTCEPDHDFYANGILTHNCFDDPIKIEEADSDAVRTAAHRYIDQVFLGRMNDPRGSRVVGIAQRTHHDDVTGHLLRESSLPWVHLKLPTEYDPRAVMDIHEVSPIGWKDPRTHKGELLWPSRFTAEVIEQTKVTLGPHGYSAQHQQDPSPLEGGIIRREWWRFWVPRGLQPETRAALLAPIRSKEGIEYPPAVELPDFKTDDRGGGDELLQSWDASFKDEAGQVRKGRPPDPVSGGCWGRAGAQCFLLDRVNERMDIVALVQAIRDMTTRFPKAVKKIVEDKANGPAAIAILRREVGGLIPASPQGSKVSRVMTAASSSKDSDARAMSMVALLAAHNVYVPHPAIAPWVWDYIEEHAAFPNGSHDDDVDMTSQALLHLQPWIWREADKSQMEVLGQRNEPPMLDTREMLRRRVLAASGLDQKPPAGGRGQPFVNPYARNRRGGRR